MKIVVDAMGGDFAPKVNVDGAIDALREYPDMDIILVGPQALVEETISAYGDAEALGRVRERLTVVDAPEVITTEEHPVMALRRKKNSTFVVGMDIVRRKEAQAFVSAGSTGALMAGAMFKIGRIKGIDRPALATLLPVPGRPMLLVDAGANTDCQPKWIVQFAMMGSAYMRRVMNVSDPEVGLLNIGVEAAKGNEQAQAAYDALSAQEREQVENDAALQAAHERFAALKSAAVLELEAQIGALGAVTLDSESAVEQAEAAFAALPEEEQGQVENQAVLLAARETLDAAKQELETHYAVIEGKVGSDGTGYLPRMDGTMLEIRGDVVALWLLKDRKTAVVLERDGTLYTLTGEEKQTLAAEVSSVQTVRSSGVLYLAPRFLRRWASAKRSSTATLPLPQPRAAMGLLRAIHRFHAARAGLTALSRPALSRRPQGLLYPEHQRGHPGREDVSRRENLQLPGKRRAPSVQAAMLRRTLRREALRRAHARRHVGVRDPQRGYPPMPALRLAACAVGARRHVSARRGVAREPRTVRALCARAQQ